MHEGLYSAQKKKQEYLALCMPTAQSERLSLFMCLTLALQMRATWMVIQFIDMSEGLRGNDPEGCMLAQTFQKARHSN